MEDRYLQTHVVLMDDNGNPVVLPHPILDKVKGAVALEYTEDGLNVLVEHNDKFEWMDIQLAIPVSSKRGYKPDLQVV